MRPQDSQNETHNTECNNKAVKGFSFLFAFYAISFCFHVVKCGCYSTLEYVQEGVMLQDFAEHAKKEGLCGKWKDGPSLKFHILAQRESGKGRRRCSVRPSFLT